jgi:HAD superfamily hydrolase (TIGR01509 family)
MNIRDFVDNFDVIIFDLGGVVIDLDYEATIRAFQGLGSENFQTLYSQALQSDLFDRYETGQISSLHFINKLKELLPQQLTPNQIVAAWNAMIQEFQPEKLRFLEEIKKTHTTALLSNTNDLHIDFVRRKLSKVSEKSLENYFHYTFLSHEIQIRKPNEHVFQFACQKMNISPEKVLFIDDSIQHVEGAKKAGLNAILFPQNESFSINVSYE